MGLWSPKGNSGSILEPTEVEEMGKKNHLMYYTDTPSAYRLLLTSSCTYTGMQVAVQQQGGKKK